MNNLNLNQKAQELMGKCWHDWRLSVSVDWKYQCRKCQDVTNYKSLNYPRYTNSIADAFELVKFCYNHKFLRCRIDFLMLGVEINQTTVFAESIDKLPLAITRAFIEAMENLK